jgi:hypothetical protein
MRLLRYGLLLGLFLLLLAAVPAGASNKQTYQDSTGEGGADPAVPDITTLVASNDDVGLLTLKISIPNRPQLTRDMAIVVFIDSDNNVTTGDTSTEDLFPGADYVIQLLLGEVLLFKWDGTDFVRRGADPPQVSLHYAYANGAVTITISAAELGNTKRFGFGVLAVSGLVIDEATGNIDNANSKSDIAPAPFTGFYSYEVKTAPARLVFKKLSTAPNPPRAGRTFTVKMSATRIDTKATISSGEVDCKAKAGSKALKPKSEKFVGGQAVCVFQVPAGTKGKTLRGTITITFEGRKLTRPFSGKIA